MGLHAGALFQRGAAHIPRSSAHCSWRDADVPGLRDGAGATMKLLDLFCGAGVVESRRANQVRVLRRQRIGATKDLSILFDEVRSEISAGLAQRSGLSALRGNIRGTRAGRRESPTLLTTLRETAQHQDDQGVARRPSRLHEEVQRESSSKDPGCLEKEGGGGARAHHCAPRRGMCGVRRSESSLAPCGFHSDHEGVSISPSSPLCLYREASGTVPRALCKSPLRIDADRED